MKVQPEKRMYEAISIMKICPSLIPNIHFKLWNGMIVFEDQEVPITISAPYFPYLKDYSLKCPASLEKEFKQKLKHYKEDIGDKNGGLLHLLQYLRNKDGEENSVDKNTKQGSGSLMKSEYYLYNKILNELGQIGSEHIVTCSSDLNEVTLRSVDIRGIEHRLVVFLPHNYPTKRPTVQDIDLPDVAVSELNQSETLSEMFNTFQALVDSYQEFWNTYDSLTKNTWVIDPEHPSHKDTHCRIVIGENVSMQITFNAQDVNNCPDIKFLGPDNIVVSFINLMEKKLKTVGWNEELSVYDNLLSLLDISRFPQPDLDSRAAPQQGECSICFMVRLEDQALPTKVCNNLKCNSYFHIPCLAQWFQAVPTNETSFNLISGDCPCCGERILCPIKIS